MDSERIPHLADAEVKAMRLVFAFRVDTMGDARCWRLVDNENFAWRSITQVLHWKSTRRYYQDYEWIVYKLGAMVSLLER